MRNALVFTSGGYPGVEVVESALSVGSLQYVPVRTGAVIRDGGRRGRWAQRPLVSGRARLQWQSCSSCAVTMPTANRPANSNTYRTDQDPAWPAPG